MKAAKRKKVGLQYLNIIVILNPELDQTKHGKRKKVWLQYLNIILNPELNQTKPKRTKYSHKVFEPWTEPNQI